MVFFNTNAQIRLDKFESYECTQGSDLDYNFIKSFASQRSSGITVLDKAITNDELNILIGIYGNCAFGDTSAITVKSDTIELLYGPHFIPSSDPSTQLPDEFDVALCDCYLNFRYILKGLNKNINYILSLRNMVLDEKNSMCFDVITNESRSIFFNATDDELITQFKNFINNSTDSYKYLSQLYNDLSIDLPPEQWKSKTMEINKVWYDFISSEKAIRDPFIRKRINKEIYNYHIQQFETTVDSITIGLNRQYDRLAKSGIKNGFIKTDSIIK